MRRKLRAIWRILSCRNYLLVIKENTEAGSHILYDFTMPVSDARMTATFLIDIIDEQDLTHQKQEKTLEAFKAILH
jgi:hypothetical protein